MFAWLKRKMTSLSQWRQEVSKKKEDERFRGDATLCGSAVSCADAAAVTAVRLAAEKG